MRKKDKQEPVLAKPSQEETQAELAQVRRELKAAREENKKLAGMLEANTLSSAAMVDRVSQLRARLRKYENLAPTQPVEAATPATDAQPYRQGTLMPKEALGAWRVSTGRYHYVEPDQRRAQYMVDNYGNDPQFELIRLIPESTDVRELRRQLDRATEALKYEKELKARAQAQRDFITKRLVVAEAEQQVTGNAHILLESCLTVGLDTAEVLGKIQDDQGNALPGVVWKARTGGWEVIIPRWSGIAPETHRRHVIDTILQCEKEGGFRELGGVTLVSREEAEQFLAEYHKQVWEAAESNDTLAVDTSAAVDYDMAGVELAKEFLNKFVDEQGRTSEQEGYAGRKEGGSNV